jgi:hypothetical protein
MQAAPKAKCIDCFTQHASHCLAGVLSLSLRGKHRKHRTSKRFMRPKVVLTILATTLVLFGALFALRQSTNQSTPAAEKPATISSAQTNETVISAAKPAERVVAVPAKAIQPAPSEGTQKKYVEERSSQLMDLAMNDDRASLDTILAELGNRDPEIRKAALEATIQFGSRDAIPKLADAVSQTDDPNEKAALTDAIEFLKLPSLTEIRQQQAANSVARNGTGTTVKPGRKGAFGKRDLPTPAPATQPNQ